MSLATIHSRAQDGVAAPAVTVEVHLSGGLPGTSIVGLPETAVKEARDRVRVAIQNAQLEYPARRVTVSLAPADLPKDGGRFDLPIALGILAAAGHVPKDHLARYEFLGELALSGELRAVAGVLPAVLKAAAAGRRGGAKEGGDGGAPTRATSGGATNVPSKVGSMARIRTSSGGWVAHKPPKFDLKACAKKKCPNSADALLPIVPPSA